MSFVKIDTGITDSSLWQDKPARDLFFTALCMAQPFFTEEPLEALEIRSLEKTGFIVPEGGYGFVKAASTGIIAREGFTEMEDGFAALERLGSPEPFGKGDEFDGRRMVRVPGGFIILNYFRYRDMDHSNAERQARFRQKQKMKERDAAKGTGKKAKASQGELEIETYKHQSPEFKTAWGEWEQYCKEKRKKLTPSTITKQLKVLAGMTEAEAIQSMENSIQNNWVGLFQRRDGKTGGGSGYGQQAIGTDERSWEVGKVEVGEHYRSDEEFK